MKKAQALWKTITSSHANRNQLFLFCCLTFAFVALGCEMLDEESDDEIVARATETVENQYEAEDATSKSGCKPASDHSGFTGSGFMDFGGNGTWIELNNIEVPQSGEYTLTFRYANGSGGNRQAAIIVNGQNKGNLSFAKTGSWTSWKTKTDALKVSLRQGNNTIRVKANTGSGGPNLDHIAVKGEASVDNCPDDPNKTEPGECGCNVEEGTCDCKLNLGHSDYCKECGPCDEGEGDCDDDSQCSGDLVCKQQDGVDYCVREDQDCELSLGHTDYCKECGPCDEGEGDCDDNSQCSGDLVCNQQDGVDRCRKKGDNDEIFTIGIMPDTQRLTEQSSRVEALQDMARFFVDRKDELNVKFVISVGDMTQNENRSVEWERIRETYDVFEYGGIPYAPCQGNHDSISSLNRYFPVSDFKGTKTWGGSRRGGIEDAYYFLSVGEIEFLIAVTQYRDKDAMRWARDIFGQYPDMHGIHATHMMTPTSSRNDIIEEMDSLFMGVYGHECDLDDEPWLSDEGEHYWKVTSDSGNIQHRLLSDYQCRDNKGATVRYYVFNPLADEVCAYTYDVYNDKYETDKTSQFCFHHKM